MKIILLGYGRMGRDIERLAIQKDHEVVHKIERRNRASLTKEALIGVDVAIDFSGPDAAFELIQFCLDNQVPVVSGSTGWLDRYDEIVSLTHQKGTGFFYASNFSIGMNIFFKINQQLARLMGEHGLDFKPSIREIHHVHKKDAPSGTAKTIANQMISNIPSLNSWSIEAPSEDSILPIEVVRENEVSGTHEVQYNSAIDTMSIAHVAHSRQGFVNGAVRAAEFMEGKKGVFGMDDLLGL